MSVSSAIIGPTIKGDSAEIPARLGQAGGLISSLLAGSFYEQCIRGNLYAFSTAAAGIVMAAPASTNQFTIWNMAGNQVLFVPIRMSWGIVSGAAAIAGAIQYYKMTGMSAAVGTAAPFSIFTNIAPLCCYIGGQTAGIGAQAACRFSTTNTATGAFTATFLGSTGTSTLQSRPANADSPVVLTHDIRGVAIWPSSCFVLTANTAMAYTAVITVWGIEVQLPLWAT